MTITLAPGLQSVACRPAASRWLAALPPADLQRWLPHLEAVSLAAGTVLMRESRRPDHVYFPTTAAVSLMRSTSDGGSFEVSTIGNEGIVGLPGITGAGAPRDAAVVRVAGIGIRVSRDWMHSEIHHSPATMSLLLRYMQVLMSTTAQSAVCSAHHAIEQRLCRCLLGMHDRTGDANMSLTHAHLAAMLGVRREGVTEVARKLLLAGAVDYSRGRMTLVDLPALEARSCECYQVAKSEYDGLLRCHAPAALPPPQARYRPVAMPMERLASARPGGQQRVPAAGVAM